MTANTMEIPVTAQVLATGYVSASIYFNFSS